MTATPAEIDLETSTDAAAIGRAAFNRIAARDFEAARPLLERALSLQPRDIMLAHVKAHLTADSGAYREGAEYLRAFLAADDGTHRMHAHTCWHLAELELELGRPAAALDLHERYVVPRVAALPITFYSAVTLLWRLELIGFGRARNRQLPWQRLHAARATILAKPAAPSGMSNPPALDHVAHGMTSIATRDDRGLDGILGTLGAAGAAGDTGDASAGEVAVPLVRGLREFWQGDYPAALASIEPVAPSFGRLTRFSDQLTVFEDTLVEAQLRAGRDADAEPRLRRRLTRIQSARDLFRLGRALRGQARHTEAAATLRAARDAWPDAEPDSPEVVALEALLA